MFSKPCQKHCKFFTLIELLVITAQHCRDFFKRFICTDKYGCVRKHTENAAHKNTPLFLKEKGSARGKENFFSREKKFACPLASHPFTLIELLVVIAIIAILAAILLPALQSARNRGKSAGCQSNLKQISSAFLQYSDDFETYGPYCDPIAGGNTAFVWKYDPIGKYIFPNSGKTESMTNHPLLLCPGFAARGAYPYAGKNGGEIIPSDDRIFAQYCLAFGIASYPSSTYYGWRYVDSIKDNKVNQNPCPATKLLGRRETNSTGALTWKFKSPSIQVMVGDIARKNSSSTIYPISTLQHQGYNNARFDGSVMFSRYQELTGSTNLKTSECLRFLGRL